MNRYLILISFSILLITSCKTEEYGPHCPILCADDDTCTIDHCSESTDYKCVHDRIENCCTTSEDCSGDTPDCVDNECSDNICASSSDCPTERPNCIHNICYEFECIFDNDCEEGKCVDKRCV